MRIIILITLVIVAQVGFCDDKIKEIIKQGIVTRAALNHFCTNDIPEKWRTKVEDQSTNDYTKKVYFRGEQKILEVMWKSEWSGTKSNIFAATIFDDQKRIGKIISFSDATVNVFQPRNTRDEYDMTTSIKTNGLATVMFSNDDGYLQVIELRGRDTRLVSDLEYTKSAVMVDQVGKPLVDAVKDKAGKSTEKTK